MLRVIHILEVVAVVFGLVILTAAFVNFSVAEAAGLPPHLVSDAHPLVFFAGLILSTLPVSRRVVEQLFLKPDNITEFQQIGAAMRRIGLLNRVQSLNLYLGDLPDESWRNVFTDDKELWEWLGEAYEDETLRRHMHPNVARKAREAALSQGCPQAV